MFPYEPSCGTSLEALFVTQRGLERNIMLMPGRAFQPDPSQPCQHLRAAFSIAAEDKFDVAMERLAGLVREELQRQQ